jgi:hypothetical protein
MFLHRDFTIETLALFRSCSSNSAPMNPPLSVVFDLECRRAQVVYEAQPSFEQWQATIEEILQDKRFRSGFGILLDRSRIPNPASSAYIHRLVDFADRHARDNVIHWAIVTCDITSFGMGRMAEQLAEAAKIRTFKNRRAAELWLERVSPDSNADGG